MNSRKKIAIMFSCCLMGYLPCNGMERDQKHERKKTIFLNQNYFNEESNEINKFTIKEDLNIEKKHNKRRKKKKNKPTGPDNYSLRKSARCNNANLIENQEEAYEDMASPMRNHDLLPTVSQEASGFEDVFGCQLPSASHSHEEKNSFEETRSSSLPSFDSQESPKVNKDFKSQRRTPKEIKAITLQGKKTKVERLMKK